MRRNLYANKLGELLRDKRLPEDARKRKRALSPVARSVRIEHKPGPDATHGPDPFDHWMRETIDKGAKIDVHLDAPIGQRVAKYPNIPREILRAMAEPYDIDAMKAVNDRGGLKQLIRLMCPSLSAERQRMLYEKLSSLCHAKQRQHEIATAPALIVGDKEHRARRLTKSERRALREGKGRRVK